MPIDKKYIDSLKDSSKDIKFEFKENVKYLISVGRIIPLKRNKDLIDAFLILQKEDEELELIFLGDGFLKNELIKYCNNIGISKKVHFIGNVENTFYYLNKSNLFILNSETEGFPNVLVEAMAVGLPVISSDCKSGPTEILDNEKYGLLYPVGDVNKLIKKIQYYLYNNELNLKEIKALNLKRADDFNLKIIMKKYTEIIQGKEEE